jgi:hypothetical protein
MTGWFSKGFEDAESQVASNSSNWTREFFLKSGEEAEGIRIIDEDSTNIRAHFVKGKGWFTCIQGVDDEMCPLCEAAQEAGSPVGKAQNQFVFNVFDPRVYVDKKGEEHKNQVKLWRVGITLLRVLNKKRNKYGPYPNLILELSKLGSGQSTAWNIEVEKASKEVILPDGEEPYDLMEVLAPKPRAELVAMLNGTPIASNSAEDEDEDAPINWRKG